MNKFYLSFLFGLQPQLKEEKWVGKRTNFVINALELPISPTDFWGGERSWSQSSFLRDKWYNQLFLNCDTSIKS